jgi:F like protein
MAAVNARLQDEAVDHAVNLHRYSNGVIQKMIAILNRSDARISAELAQVLMKETPSRYAVERLEAKLASVRALNREAYAQVFKGLDSEMSQLSLYEARYQPAVFRRLIPSAIQVDFPIFAANPDTVYSAVVSRPFQGRLLSGWAATLPENRMRLFREAIRAGFVEGKSASDIVRSISGTKALNYADGLLDRPRRDLMTVVNTALAHTAQTARQAFYDQNMDIIKAIRWVSTLDTKTSEECRIRDGLKYTADAKHLPIGHTIPWLQGPGRLHFNCRSVSVPITNSWRELGIDIDDMPAGTRASMDGQVPGDTNYSQWLARQSAARQDEILGAKRGALLRQGVPMERFYNDKGQWLTLDELYGREGLTRPD